MKSGVHMKFNQKFYIKYIFSLFEKFKRSNYETVFCLLVATVFLQCNIVEFIVLGDSAHYNEFESGKPQKTEPQNAINILNNVLLRKSVVSKLSRYDLMLGVVKAEAYFAFNGEDVQYGIEADRRSKILRTFVRNTYSYHLSEILATIVNEYTDWERPVQHPINIRDETLEALSDAQYVAPVVHTADLHSAEHRNSYLYVFDYQTKFGDYPQVK